MDIILKEYDLAIKENNNMFESAIDNFYIKANELYMLECEGYMVDDNEANDLFMEAVKELKDKIKEFFRKILNTIKAFGIKVTNKIKLKTGKASVSILVKSWNKTIAKMKKDGVWEPKQIETIDYDKLMNSYVTYLSEVINVTQKIQHIKYDDVEKYEKTVEKICNTLLDKSKNIEKSYTNMDVDKFINSSILKNYEPFLERMVKESEIAITKLDSYCLAENDMNKIRAYKEICSIVLNAYRNVSSVIATELEKNIDKCNSILYPDYVKNNKKKPA